MLYPCCIYAAIYAILKLFYMSYDYQHKGDTAPSGARDRGVTPSTTNSRLRKGANKVWRYEPDCNLQINFPIFSEKMNRHYLLSL